MIIGLCGYAGSGKTIAAWRLTTRYGFLRRKFAAPLKDMMRTFLSAQGVETMMVEDMIEGSLKERPTPFLNGASPRHAMQTLGTDWGRALIHEDLWSDAAMRGIQGLPKVVFDDVRFPNEADAIRSAGGKVVLISRAGVGPVNSHASEVLPPYDFDVTNDASVEEMVSAILRTTR